MITAYRHTETLRKEGNRSQGRQTTRLPEGTRQTLEGHHLTEYGATQAEPETDHEAFVQPPGTTAAKW